MEVLIKTNENQQYYVVYYGSIRLTIGKSSNSLDDIIRYYKSQKEVSNIIIS